MADNVSITPGSGATIAADDVSSVLYQLVKLAYGSDGAATMVDTNNALPVNQQSALPAGTNNIGDVDVASVAIPSSVYHGQTTVSTAGTEVALASSQALLSGVTVKALSGNSGAIYVGTNPVTSSTGFELSAGDSIFIEADDLATIYVDAAQDGDSVCYIGS